MIWDSQIHFSGLLYRCSLHLKLLALTGHTPGLPLMKLRLFGKSFWQSIIPGVFPSIIPVTTPTFPDRIIVSFSPKTDFPALESDIDLNTGMGSLHGCVAPLDRRLSRLWYSSVMVGYFIFTPWSGPHPHTLNFYQVGWGVRDVSRETNIVVIPWALSLGAALLCPPLSYLCLCLVFLFIVPSLF